MMTKAAGKQAQGRRHRRILSVALGTALMFPSVSTANVQITPPPSTVAGENRTAWPGPWSRTAVQRLIVAEAVAQGAVSVPLALAVADAASGFEPRTVGVSGSIGVMQLHPDGAKRNFGVEATALRDPAVNVRVGLERLARLQAVRRFPT